MDPRLERAALQGPALLTVHTVADRYPMVVASDGAQRMLGFSASELTEAPHLWSSRIHSEDEGRVMRGLVDIGHVRAGEVHFRFQRKDGAFRWLRAGVRVTQEDQGQPAELAFALQDVTERKEYEQALRQQVEALRRSNVELEQFAHIASHDLSEPLRMVASYTRLIADRYSEQLDDDARDFIGFAVGGAERMQSMIRDLLTYSRLSQADPVLQPLALDSVLDTVEAVLRATIAESGTRIVRCDDLPRVMGAEAQCLTVLQNLISNAIKFRHPDRTPEIKVSAKRDNERVRISVQDNGIGIEAKAHERVFEAFKKLHRHEVYPGTGLGLSLCRRIVDHHGGSMGLESEPDVGTTVWFTLAAPEALDSAS